MNSCVKEFYKKQESDDKGFYDVILIDDSCKVGVERLQELCIDFPKEWFELSRLDPSLKIEFARDYCLEALPYVPRIYGFLYDFFSKIEDIDIFLTKKEKHDLYKCELVYSMKDGSFFRGNPPANEETIDELKTQFNILPKDFIAFLKIHDGFSKNLDSGIIPAEKLKEVSDHFYENIFNSGKVIKCGKKIVDPSSLIPFYTSFLNEDFQCFYADWFQENEMGNVFYSEAESSISDYHNDLSWVENLSFPTFLDWLLFYIEETTL
jgi:hypothetical protein